MDLGEPIRSVIPSAHGAVLAVLARTAAALNGRQVAALAEGAVSAKGAYNALQQLVEAGVVLVEVRPREKLYALNRRHLAAGAIEDLANLRGRLISALRAEIATWQPAPVGAWLFGSAARGDGDSASDVDLLLVRPSGVAEDDPPWLERGEELVDAVQGWTGNRCALIEYQEEELVDLMASDERLADELVRDAIALGGRMDLRSLRRGPAR